LRPFAACSNHVDDGYDDYSGYEGDEDAYQTEYEDDGPADSQLESDTYAVDTDPREESVTVDSHYLDDSSAAGSEPKKATCSLCNATFPSGNRLHDHLKREHSGSKPTPKN
jgi:hypothetical protein